jgi:hypothetical protein
LRRRCEPAASQSGQSFVENAIRLIQPRACGLVDEDCLHLKALACMLPEP